MTPMRIVQACAPTAYDVEAVSKALKNEMEFVVNEYPVYGRYIKKNRAIEILHSGVIHKSHRKVQTENV